MSHEGTLSNAPAGTGEGIDFSGAWVNDLTSEVTIIQNGDLLSGTYESAVSGGGTKTIGDLLGYADGDLISFVVHWREFQAITAWAGQLDRQQIRINTLWQMTKQVAAGEEWESINSGADSFKRK